MSTLTILFLLLVSTAAEAQTRSSNITLGSSLTPTSNSTWSSPSGVYAFGFFSHHVNSYAVGIFLPDKTIVWTANRDTNTDGKLVLRRRQGPDVEVISPATNIASASMLDNGNFVLYDSESRIIWKSFDYPTNTLLPGQRLISGKELFSSASETDYRRGIFKLTMQGDGNLVQYPVDSPSSEPYAYYNTETYRAGGNVSLELDSDGRLYLVNGSLPLKNISSGGFPMQGSINLMRLDVGGIFRIYSLSLGNLAMTRRWSSTLDECDPKGFCGVNSFCVLMDNKPDCLCLPSFVYIQSGNNTAGCSRNFLAQGCHKIDDRLKYDMKRVENSEWEDNSYENLNVMSESMPR